MTTNESELHQTARILYAIEQGGYYRDGIFRNVLARSAQILGLTTCERAFLRLLKDSGEADARALWAVRVLDAWAEIAAGSWESDWRFKDATVGNQREYSCVLIGNAHDRHAYYAATPDAARIVAATALVAADPTLDPDAPRGAP